MLANANNFDPMAPSKKRHPHVSTRRWPAGCLSYWERPMFFISFSRVTRGKLCRKWVSWSRHLKSRQPDASWV